MILIGGLLIAIARPGNYLTKRETMAAPFRAADF